MLGYFIAYFEQNKKISILEDDVNVVSRRYSNKTYRLLKARTYLFSFSIRRFFHVLTNIIVEVSFKYCSLFFKMTGCFILKLSLAKNRVACGLKFIFVNCKILFLFVFGFSVAN